MFPGSGQAEMMVARVVDRTFSFSSSSVAFLHRHGLSVEDAVKYGIPYLSRTEENLVCAQILERDLNLHSDEPINISQQKTETQAFYNDAREKILQFHKDTKQEVCLSRNLP